jgi:hypothetical protein
MNENISFEFEFQSSLKVGIEESSSGSAIIEGTLLSEGISRNGNVYTIEEMENIAKQAEGVTIFYGTKTGINPKTGVICTTLHNNDDDQKIGKVIKTTLNKLSKKIHFIAEVFNTANHPDMIAQIKAGWGVSIGGFVTKAEYIKDAFGRMLLKVKDMIVNHLQVIPPTTIRGMDSAKIDSVNVQETYQEIQECMMFDLPTIEEDIPINIVISRPWVNI